MAQPKNIYKPGQMIEEYPSPPEDGYLNKSQAPDISGEYRNDKITFRNISSNNMNDGGNVSKFLKSVKPTKKYQNPPPKK